MAFLELKDIGKIYVSEGNVAIGIRGVNLTFERGEFVAVTGKSGSGKSTLLNVISGMDSYEEGELYVEGQPTSHYMQPDWEEYRQRYISFIFQDYNIIESFTVLQNVELALMHIEDKRERRRRALELIERVGLLSHKSHKGSRLSGGQKQRTVIARALAKDSPIILADEPTGNLDSKTADDIIRLLKEVSKDKLLIVVTHNFDQVEQFATRHVRVFDGAVESDHVISRPEAINDTVTAEKPERRERISHSVKNGITLGKTVFLAKPKLSMFLCFLMVIGMLGIFAITAFCGGATELFEPNYMFERIEGRVVLVKQNGAVITEDELTELAKTTGAKSYLHYDILLDKSGQDYAWYMYAGEQEYFAINATYEKDFGTNIIGRYPQSADEVFLRLPISYKPYFGENKVEITEIHYMNITLKVTGVQYYYDNNISADCLFTKEGFDIATATYYLQHASLNTTITLLDKDGAIANTINSYGIIVNHGVEKNKLYVNDTEFNTSISKLGLLPEIQTSGNFYKYDYYNGYDSIGSTFKKNFDSTYITSVVPNVPRLENYRGYLIMSPDLAKQMAEEYLSLAYRQASLFYEDNDQAYSKIQSLKDKGYIAVPSDTTYTPDAFTTIISTISAIFIAFTWVITIVFLAFFINLCLSRTLGAFKSEMAIMRSMGIQVKVIRIGMYVRMLISLVPATILMILAAVLIFTSPKFNEYFTYLYFWQYALIFLGMLLLTVRVTYKQIRKLFGETVKKSLKGGEKE